MARKKKGKSLLEVIGTDPSKGDRSLGVPSWFNKADDQPVGGTTGPDRTEQDMPKPADEPVMSVSGGRLRVSLNQVSAIVLFLAIILLGAGAFFLGRRTAPKTPAPAHGAATGGSDSGRPGGKHPSVVPVPGSDAGGDATNRRTSGMVSDDATRKKGYSYLVIQGDVQTYEQAQGIKRFLYANSIDATVHKSRHTGKYKVTDMRGFRNIHSAQTKAAINKYVEQIERLGDEYLRRGGRYGFKQSRSSGIWMISEN